MRHQPVSVVTTIQAPTLSILALLQALRPSNCPLLIIGDKKGPSDYNADGAELVTFEEQSQLPYKLARLLPVGHYTRKNIGYLLAFERGATCIYETDDDNAPLSSWRWREQKVRARHWSTSGWVNVYKAFSDENIWPRGLPLQFSRFPQALVNANFRDVEVESPIQQGLANGSPDVDAVWRLILDKDVVFRNEPSIYLPPAAWCPFNSQTTWWWPPAYPLMYLPSFCSFRMTDIWRSFVAQRCLWELNTGVVFHAAEVVQNRNEHSFIKDFEDEISGYLKNDDIKRVLVRAQLKPGVDNVSQNLLTCYELLVDCGVLPSAELSLVRAWLEDLEALRPRFAD